MNRASASVSLAFPGVLAFVFGGFAFLIYGVAGDRSDLRVLPTDDVRLDVLPDPSLQLALPDVLSQPASAWRPHTGDYYIQASNGGSVWVRATFTNFTGRPIHGVLADDELIVDRLDCWTPDPTEPEGWLHQVSGETIPGRLKPIRGRETAVYITVPAHGELVAYLRAKDHFHTWFRAVWWPESTAFLTAQLRHTLVEALYFGVLVSLLIYNAVLWVRLRHRDLGYYLGYLGSMAVFMVFSRAQPQLLGFPLGSPFLEPLVTTALASTGFFLVQFAREFFGLRAVAPRLDRVARAFGWLNLGLGLGAPALLWSKTSLWMHIVIPGIVATHITLLVMAVLVWRLGVRQARFFLLSFGVFLVGGAPFVYHWMRAIPLGDTALPLMVGSALEMLLLSLAVADRFARISQDRHTAQLAEEKARLESLRYQLNPHFLFNALNSIYGLVYPHSATAGDLVRRLADFCRDTLTRPGGKWQPLGDELAMLRNYLGIEQARWRDQLALEFDLDPRADAFLLPPFLLLPLVDNAIKHGGATSPGVLTVRLVTRHESNGGVTLSIVNSGAWTAHDQRKPRAANSTGVGLENIRARLAHAFPVGHELVTHAAEGWVTLTLRLPPPSATE